MIADELMLLQGRDVDVTYWGVVYHGQLVGADESDLYLMTAAGSINLPLASITSVQAS